MMDASQTNIDFQAGRAGAVTRLWILTKKELWSYFTNPTSWLILFFFYLYRGVETYNLVFHLRDGGDADMFGMQYLAGSSTYWAVVLLPSLLTMKTFAEERRTGSLELLMSSPIQDHEVVVGKYLGSLLFFAFLWLPTLVLLLILQSPLFLNVDLSLTQVIVGYLGLFLLGSLLISVGVFTSSLTDNQLLASLASMLGAYALLVFPPQLAGAQTTVDSGILPIVIEQISVIRHLGSWFFRGLIDTGHLFFYISTTLLFLFLTTRVVESRKWR
jgi:gliding motility-associated transport system permease protein